MKHRLSYSVKVLLASLLPFAIVMSVLMTTKAFDMSFYYVAVAIFLSGVAVTVATRRLITRPIAALNHKAAAMAATRGLEPVTAGIDGIRALESTFDRVFRAIGEHEARLERAYELLERAERVAGLGAWKWTIGSGEIEWSDEVFRIFGLEPGEFEPSYEDFIKCVHPEDRGVVIEAIDAATHRRSDYLVEHRVVRPDGSVRWVREAGQVARDRDGRAESMVGTVLDITKTKDIDDRYRMLSTALDHNASIVFFTDTEGRIRYVNTTFERVTGYPADHALGRTPSILKSGRMPDEFYKDMWTTLSSGEVWRGVVTNKSRNGRLFDAKAVISPVRDETGRVLGYLAIQEDLAGRREAERKQRIRAMQDPTSGLLNRRGLLEALQTWVQRNRGGRGRGALMLADLDGFRIVNEALGHKFGDELLIRVARRFDDIVRTECRTIGVDPFVARMYGDEYGAFVPTLDQEKAMKLAEAIRLGIEAMTLSETDPDNCTMSLGVALFPDHGIEVTDLLSRSDAALFRAKEMGRNKTYVFRPEDKDIEDHRMRLRQRDAIVRALDEDRFTPFFQPILDLRSDTVHHFEALARMRDEQDEYQAPWAFIETAESFGLAWRIDRAILDRTIEVLLSVAREEREASFAVNLSGKDLGNEEFLRYLKDRVASSELIPGGIVFELTETQAVNDLDRASHFMRDMKKMGCRFALDDFGVGFSSFRYLKLLPVDMVKIDGSFIRNLDKDSADREFVKAMVQVCRRMSIETVAEFVENGDIIGVIRDIGVDYAQGYHVARPGPELVWDVAA